MSSLTRYLKIFPDRWSLLFEFWIMFSFIAWRELVPALRSQANKRIFTSRTSLQKSNSRIDTRMIAGIMRGYRYRAWLLASCVIAGIACDCWSCAWLLASCVAIGCVLLLAPRAIARIVHDHWHRVLLAPRAIARIMYDHWHRVLLLSSQVYD